MSVFVFEKLRNNNVFRALTLTILNFCPIYQQTLYRHSDSQVIFIHCIQYITSQLYTPNTQFIVYVILSLLLSLLLLLLFVVVVVVVVVLLLTHPSISLTQAGQDCCVKCSPGNLPPLCLVLRHPGDVFEYISGINPWCRQPSWPSSLWPSMIPNTNFSTNVGQPSSPRF